MTPNKLAVYFVADMVLADMVVADMVVADIDFPCGRYGFLLWPIIVLLWPIWLWPIWFVADMVARSHPVRRRRLLFVGVPPMSGYSNYIQVKHNF